MCLQFENVGAAVPLVAVSDVDGASNVGLVCNWLMHGSMVPSVLSRNPPYVSAPQTYMNVH